MLFPPLWSYCGGHRVDLSSAKYHQYPPPHPSQESVEALECELSHPAGAPLGDHHVRFAASKKNS